VERKQIVYRVLGFGHIWCQLKTMTIFTTATSAERDKDDHSVASLSAVQGAAMIDTTDMVGI
jgi:hypothetical protein